jgi:hypothetical protein
MIKELSCGKILDKNKFYVSGIFCNFKNFVSNFLVKFDQTIGFKLEN